MKRNTYQTYVIHNIQFLLLGQFGSQFLQILQYTYLVLERHNTTNIVDYIYYIIIWIYIYIVYYKYKLEVNKRINKYG